MSSRAAILSAALLATGAPTSAQPPAPELLGPGGAERAQRVSEARPTFRWRPVPGAARYVLRITTADARSRVFRGIQASSFRPPESLAYGYPGPLRWSVAACDAADNCGAFAFPWLRLEIAAD